MSEASSFTPSWNSFHSKTTRGAFSSPSPWYFARIFKASSFRPTETSQRGDYKGVFRVNSTESRKKISTSGRKNANPARMAAGTIWRAKGSLQERVPELRPVATVIPAVTKLSLSEYADLEEETHCTKSSQNSRRLEEILFADLRISLMEPLTIVSVGRSQSMSSVSHPKCGITYNPVNLPLHF